MAMLSSILFICHALFSAGARSGTSLGSRDALSAGSESWVKATWIPTSYRASTRANARQTVRELAAAGINRIYVATFNNGKAYFQSSAMRGLAGAGAVGPDRLGMFRDAAREFNIQVYAWFEYGLMANYGRSSAGNAFAEAVERRGWILGNHKGWQWMHPSKASPWLAQFIREASTGPYAGIKTQLDDHFACPTAFWQCNAQIMNAAARIVAPVTYSLSPSTLHIGQKDLNVNWDQWAREGLFQEFVPQLYSSSHWHFTKSLNQLRWQLPSHIYPGKVLVGIRVDGTGSPTAWGEANQMIDSLKREGLGVSVWYARGVTEMYPSQFKAKWGWR